MINSDFDLPISALQHLLFCPRQCALIYLERQWDDNILTALGQIEHQRLDLGYKEFRRGKRQISGLYIRSQSLQLHGRLDVLELELIDAHATDNLSALGLKGNWQMRPVEFKHGEPKDNDCDRVQLCAQAIALEEMFGIHIPEASLFYHRIRHREEVLLDQSMRERTKRAAEQLHAFFQQGKTPPPSYSPRCRSCSLIDVCLPKKISSSGQRYRLQLFSPQEPTS